MRLILACMALAGAGLVGCSGDTQNVLADAATNGSADAGKGLAAVEEAEGLATAGKLLKSAGLEKVLTGPGSYTVFAPSDDAFEALPEGERKLLESEEGRPQLLALLRQHIAPGYVTPGDFSTAVARSGPRVEVASLGAEPIIVRQQGEAILLGTGEGAARIVGGSVPLGNSIVYRIDRVLPPPAG